MTQELRARIERAIGVRVVSAYEPSGLYTWLTLADGRGATYYSGIGRVVCDEPTPYAIDVRVAR